MFVHENRSEPPQGQVFPTTAPRCRRPSSKLNPPSPAREAATPSLSSGSLLVLSLLTNSEFHHQTPARSGSPFQPLPKRVTLPFPDDACHLWSRSASPLPRPASQASSPPTSSVRTASSLACLLPLPFRTAWLGHGPERGLHLGARDRVLAPRAMSLRTGSA